MGFSNPVTSVDVLGTVDLAPGSTVGLDPGGTVDLTGGTQSGIAGQIQSAGAPPIDKVTQLADISTGPGTTSVAQTSIADANCLQFRYTLSSAVGTPSAGKISVQFISGTHVIDIREFELDVLQNNTGLLYAELPAIGDFVAVLITQTGAGSGGTFALSKSTRSVPVVTTGFDAGLDFANWSGTTVNSKLDLEWSINGSIAAGATATARPSFRAGPVNINAYVGGGAATHTVEVTTASGLSLYKGTFVGGAATRAPISLLLPRKSVLVSITNGDAAGRSFDLVVISQD